jgi:hypothetical protein
MVAKKGDFFSKKRLIKHFFYPKFPIKKMLQSNIKKGKRQYTENRILSLSKNLVYTTGSCRRLDLIFITYIYSALFKFRSTDLIFIKRRLRKIIKKKIHSKVSYKDIEKNASKLFIFFFKKKLQGTNVNFLFLIQKFMQKKILQKYRKKCYLKLTQSQNK